MSWMFPLNMKMVGSTSDSMSFQKIDMESEVEIPVYTEEFDEQHRQHHFGAFGVKRRFNRHKGVDLYCPDNTRVHSVEPGIVVQIRPFTGRHAGCPWWEDTEAISVVGKTGLVVYGEVTVDYHLSVGDVVQQGQPLGWVKTVLRKDKGRPMSMLHLELHEHHMLHTGDKWRYGDQPPRGLLDPTDHLLGAIPYKIQNDE